MMDSFIYDDEGHDWKGHVIIPSHKMNLNGEITLENKDQMKSLVKIAFISKSRT
ncbi:hypothetical protein I5M32_16135 [Pedobacter sp. SD-b]|uniref:Uncharacterized protein n=1 Tax=Pedobacter segetis TaxID=2793069 RepID=A0ABS1BNQ7_9SPHI|nr:hypothetical protein [Pedobacter segetis]MBK0384496.1 hypothetical protein [Pedobacter segetis]